MRTGRTEARQHEVAGPRSAPAPRGVARRRKTPDLGGRRKSAEARRATESRGPRAASWSGGEVDLERERDRFEDDR